jgi:tripartite-type tricarboxylate transporter receptor subunit TctC
MSKNDRPVVFGNNMDRRSVLIGGAAAAVALGSTGVAAQAAYPNRPISLMLPWAPGGGTDATARMIGSLLEKDFGVPVNVVNRTGGSGVVGHAALAAAQPDGYTIGMVTVEITMLHRQGLTELTRENYTPIGLLVSNPPGIMVNVNSPYQDVKALAEAVKASPPGKFKASGTGQGGIWHIGLIGWLQGMGLKPDHVTWVPSQGAAPAMQDLAAGGIDIATCAIPEGRAMLDAGRVRALAVMGESRNAQFPNVPTIKEAQNIDFTTGGWLGLCGPKNLPADVREKLVAATRKGYESKEFKDFLNTRGFSGQYAGGDDFGKFMAAQDATMATVMKAAGLSKA